GLAARGIPVVGLDSLRYFWNARTPQGFAADLDRVLRFYAQHWAKRRAVVIGYSQGADVLPFALPLVSAEAHALIARAVLVAPTRTAAFEVHLTNWFGGNDGELPVGPEIEKLDPERVVCIYGVDDDEESPCATLATAVRVRPLPGGHHFNRAYAELVREITDGMSW
ncbi:MAG TPA: AcvB/VirJ family lysyl-phosphatidylglycerol hydrolase, partial [Gammaproteobacteria bacterium]|nr:AcvB/VirJ family lysyl-phosphatidylglycerol hydrolase [Gammaproteobacteria bacterium]